MDYDRFTGENIEMYSHDPSREYRIPSVSGRLNPEYYAPDETHIYGYGSRPREDETMHDNFGVPYPSNLFGKYLGNKAGFASASTNSSWQLMILIIVVIAMVTSIVSLLLNLTTVFMLRNK